MTSRFRRVAALGWPGVRSSHRLYALGVVALLSLLALIPVVIAQSSRRPPAGLQLAVRALIEGRYDEVPALTGKLDAQDPNVAAVKARALVARGRYQEAETALRPIAQRAPSSAAALELGLLLQMLGRADGPAILGRVAAVAAVTNDPLELSRAARALEALGHFGEANSAYRDAVSLAPKDAAINTAWGELFLEKYNRPDALKSFQAALQDDQKYGPALLGSARALADDNPPQAAAFAKKALEVNPSDVGAQLFLAGHAVDAGHRDEARKVIQMALAVNPSSLDAHALLAALAYVEDNKQEFDAEVARVLSMAPSHGEVYRVSGDLAARNYRFDEAVALVRRALELDPRSARSLADLGVHLLRTGDEPGARQALEASFKLDAYDVVTFNLLQMMDTLDKFVTVQDGDVVLRMHKDEAPLLRDYALSLAHRALDRLSKRYGFTPKGPILIEIFPKHDDFAVRNVGLPGMIGALGACFGRVVTMDSPKARTSGPFQWEATLWHELAHVVTIQMSNQRVPRWLTEGISVYEEKRARPAWARPMEVEFAELLNRGETLKLRDLNAAFTDPRKISVAYYQASLLVEHIVTAYGDHGLQQLVRSYGQSVDTDAALRTALNTDFDRLQVGFDQSIERQFGSLRRALENPDREALAAMSLDALGSYAVEHARSYPVQMALGRALVEHGELDQATAAFERAAALVPMARGKDSPHAQMAAIALQKKDQ